jgi:thiosulfate/3-mercaptopyruvate sulfurtransferase
MYQTLIDPQTLASHLADADWVIVDCRFSLADVSQGRTHYEAAHIPGAVYAHLDDDLSGPPVTDNGRHPLPTPDALRDLFSRLGIDGSKQVVAYDDAGGMIASRLWWMLRYMGHKAVAVLNGGWQVWQQAELPTRAGVEANLPAEFSGEPAADWLVQIDAVTEQPLLIDSRGPVRYRGEEEPLDARPGHIPGAINYYFADNLDENGRFLSVDTLRNQLQALVGDTAVDDTTFYCGSGVSACVNLLALAHAGLGNGRLYVGSWSEWSRDPQRPAATEI